MIRGMADTGTQKVGMVNVNVSYRTCHTWIGSMDVGSGRR